MGAASSGAGGAGAADWARGCSSCFMSGCLATELGVMPGRLLGCNALGLGESNALGFEVSRQGGSSLSVRGDPGSLGQFGCATGSAGALERALGDSGLWSHRKCRWERLCKRREWC